MKRYFLGSALLLAGIVIYFAIRSGSTPPPASSQPATKPNIVFITIDTLRADRLGRGLTPALDALSASGVRFLNARATVPLTLPSHVSIMTGTLPPQHGVRENGVIFRKGVEPIARTLRTNGYQTAAFVGAYVLDRRFGLAEGFDIYDDRVQRDPEAMGRLEAERRGSDVIDAALAWLDQGRTPFFLWVHLYDPHAPYAAPPEFVAKAGGNAYDGEVAYADAQAGRLLQRLRDRGLADRTVIAVMGDHGEGLGDHGEQTHGMLTYDATLRVPLVIAGPGITPREVSAPVSLADVAPTILRHNGIGSTSANTITLLDEGQQERDVYSESEYAQTAGWHPIASLSGEQWKLLLSSETELYDLKADPAEARNVAGQSRRDRAGHDDEADGHAGGESRATVVQGGEQRGGRPPAGIGIRERRPRRAGCCGRTESCAGDRCVEPVRICVGAAECRTRDLCAADPAGARDSLPGWAGLSVDLRASVDGCGESQRRAGRVPGGRCALAVGCDVIPRSRRRRADGRARRRGASRRGSCAGRRSQQPCCIERSWAAARGRGTFVRGGNVLRARRTGRSVERIVLGEPRKCLARARLSSAGRRRLPPRPRRGSYHADAANGLGVLLVQGGRPAEAIPWFERALKTSADFQEARLNLGIAYQESGQKDKAVAMYRELIARAPATGREAKAARELLKSIGR